MGYTVSEVNYLSSNGKDKIYAEICVPDTEPRGIIQISHGMIDHFGRYSYLKERFTELGFIVAGNDHIGHGRSAESSEDLGYLGARGAEHIVDDLYTFNGILHTRYPRLRTVLLGHSMGSFMARLYAEKYPDSIYALIIHGTGGKNPALLPGKAVVMAIELFRGERHRSELIRKLAFGLYNKRFDPSEGDEAWLTSVPGLVKDRATDPYASYTFTVSGYRELFRALGACSSREHFASFPRRLPTLVISGKDDPVGNYGKGVRWVYESLKRRGVKNLTLKLYEGARHELFNEREREKIVNEMAEWIGETIHR